MSLSNALNGMEKGPLDIRQVIKLAQKGDRKAFQEMYILYYDRLFKYGCSISIDEGLVHDTIQDVFVWMIRNPSQLSKINNLDTYLIKCVRRNLRTNFVRAKGKRHNANRYYEGLQQDLSVEANYIQSEEREEQSLWLKAQLDELSSHQKEVIYLRFYENLSYDQMADILSVSNQVVRNSVYRALKSLRKNIAPKNSKPLRRSHFFLTFFF